MDRIVAITKALADESRIRALIALRQGELCVCQLIELLGLAPSTVSKHMAILRQAGLVRSRKEGRWIYYRLPERSAPAGIKKTLRWLQDIATGNTRIEADAELLRKISTADKEKRCRAQAKK